LQQQNWLLNNRNLFIFTFVIILYCHNTTLYLTAKYGLYKNKDEIQIVSPKLYEGKYFKHYHGGSWHSWDGEIIWWLGLCWFQTGYD
jgi:hypothetical protein